MSKAGGIVGIGAANVDFHAHSRAPLVLRDSNPGFARISAGGVTRNILENLARLGEPVTLLSAVGDDLFGSYIARQSLAAGIDVSELLCCPGEASSCYTAVLDEKGDMFVGMSDMRILEHITPAYLETKLPLLRGAAVLVCDPCLPPETLEWLSSGAAGETDVFIDPVSTAYARRLKPFAGGFACIKPNRMELGALTDCEVSTPAGLERAAEQLLTRGTKRVVVSLGREGCYWADNQGNRFTLALSPVEHMVDATGAGDAFLSGLICAQRHKMSPKEGARLALAAGRAAVMSEGTVSDSMTLPLLHKILEEQS